MAFIHNVEMRDDVESILEDWRLPPSIEDEEYMSSNGPQGIMLEEVGIQGESNLLILI
jgi:hypothetical protein